MPDLIKTKNTLKDNDFFAKKETVDEFIRSTETKRFYINTMAGNTYLTRKEIECIYWILLGKSAEEISLILACSKRTIEIHLNNSKQKLGVTKITQVIKMVIDAGIIETFKLDLEKTAC